MVFNYPVDRQFYTTAVISVYRRFDAPNSTHPSVVLVTMGPVRHSPLELRNGEHADYHG